MTQAEKDMQELCEGIISPPMVEKRVSVASGVLEKGFDPSLPLDDTRHERFAVMVAEGKPATQAYVDVYCCTLENAERNAYRVRDYDGVNQRVKYLQSQAASAKIMSQREAMEYLSDAVRTPIGEIDENSPLAQEVEYKEDGSRKVKSVPKLGAIEQLAKLAGWGSQAERPGIRLRLVASQAGVAAEIDSI